MGLPKVVETRESIKNQNIDDYTAFWNENIWLHDY